MNTRPQQSEGTDRPGQGRRAGDCFAGYSGNGAEPFLGEQVEKCNESEPVYCWTSSDESFLAALLSRSFRRREFQDLRANARRSLPQAHRGAFLEGFTPHTQTTSRPQWPTTVTVCGLFRRAQLWPAFGPVFFAWRFPFHCGGFLWLV